MRNQKGLLEEAANKVERVLLSAQIVRSAPPRGRGDSVSVGHPIELCDMSNSGAVRWRAAEVKRQVGAEDPYVLTWAKSLGTVCCAPSDDRQCVYRLIEQKAIKLTMHWCPEVGDTPPLLLWTNMPALQERLEKISRPVETWQLFGTSLDRTVSHGRVDSVVSCGKVT
eukprot:1653458-Amphidinium_carterae.2